MSTDRVPTAYRGVDRRSSADLPTVDYRGPDRRDPAAPAADPPGLRYVVFGLAAVVLAFAATRAAVVGGRGEVVTFTALRDTGYGLLVLTGTVLMVVWALTGRAARALDGAALLLMAGGLLVLGGPWGALMQSDRTVILISPACRVALGLPALFVLIRSPSVLPVDSSVRPLRTLTAAAAGALGLLAIEAAVRAWRPIDSSSIWIVAMAALTLGWFAAGLRRVLVTESTVSAKGERAMGLALITFAGGDVLLAIALHTDLGWGVLAVALQLFGAAGTAAVAVSWLIGVLSQDGSRALRLAGELTDVTSVLADEKSVRHRLLHDARNVVAAIRTASVTLERHSDRLDPTVQDQLRGVVGSELARLQALLAASHEPAGRS